MDQTAKIGMPAFSLPTHDFDKCIKGLGIQLVYFSIDDT